MITAEAFYCAKDNAIVRGKDTKCSQGRNGTMTVTGLCTLCGAKVRKRIKQERELTIPPAPDTKIDPATRKALEEEYDALQRAIYQKEEEYSRLIEKLYDGDVELGRQLHPGPLDTARLKGDDEYEQLVEKRHKLMWIVEPKVEFKD